MIVPIIIACVVFVMLYWQLRATYTIPPEWRIDGPSCGNCAYSHNGQLVCPECGHAIKHVGIVTPRLLIMFGPSLRLAVGCLLVMAMISCGLLLQVGYLIETELLPPSWRSGTAPSSQQLGMVQNIGFIRSSSSVKQPPSSSGWDGLKAPFGLTVVEQVSRSFGSGRQRATYGELVFVLRPEKANPYSMQSPEPVALFSPPLPHLRIDLVARTVQVIGADGVRTAQYPAIDRRAFDDLMRAGGIDRSDQATEEAVLAAKSVYQAIADSPDNGGPFPTWSDQDSSRRDGRSVQTMRSGGSIQNLPPPPAAAVPVQATLVRLWPLLLPVSHIAVVVIVYRWILRRRKAIMEIGGA